MESTLSSKVTVEYHDPSGVFPLIARDLAARLPLRHLNWKSPSRPLRSIGALHVEFVPDTYTEAADPSASTPEPLQRVDSYGPRANNAASAPRERRHQIPGLRQTPYLKIYLLRCDDKDAYKSTARQLLRDWIKANAAPAQSSAAANKAENHDASEWLILHVVIPDTVAAAEPRWTAASKKDTDELVERPSNPTKWPGKSTRTVLDKIRADFNPSSKTFPERIAQIRLQKKDVPSHFLPQAPAAAPHVETPQEQDSTWQDLVAKFKTLILMSFDLRVSQYEEDVREKDAQRALPGWNFCTFFTLKEGLARGFESVGLVEDALAIYDELSAGLDAALRDNDESGSDAAKGTFLGSLDGYRDSLQQIVDAASDTPKLEQLTSRFQDMCNQPLDLTRKDYRGAIVSSTISLFDFRLYIFARQRTLLLRLGTGTGNIQQARPSGAQGATKDDNLSFAAEVCGRAALFAATNSRALRKGLTDGSDSSSSSSKIANLVENVASSWTYAVLDQVLLETASKDLPSSGAVDMSPFQPQKHRPGVFSRKEAAGNFNFPQGANQHPTRTTSLQRSSSSSMQLSPQVIYENEKYTKPGVSRPDNVRSSGSGSSVLASGRAQLFLMKRRVVEALAKAKGWQSGWAALKVEPLADVDLNTDEEIRAPQTDGVQESPPSKVDQLTHTLLSAPLVAAVASIEDFREVYEQLSNLAVAHYNVAKHTKSADTVLSDLAILKYQLGDFAQASAYFQKSSASFLEENWSYVHAEMLRIYARCLKELHRRDDYMRVMLSLLGKVVARQRKRTLHAVKTSSVWLDEEDIDVSGVLDELVTFSEGLPYSFTASISDFFADVSVSPEVKHYTDKDGFSLDLQFRHLLEERLTIDRVRLRLTLTDDTTQEIWVQSDGPVDLFQGLIKVKVHSNVSTYGLYMIDKLVLESKKLHFTQEFQPKPQTTPLGITNATPGGRPSMSGPSLMLYPHGESLDARATLVKDIHIDHPRSIIIEVETGRNDAENLDLRLRAASAGLRLHTADAEVLESGHEHLDTAQGGTLGLGVVAKGTRLAIRVPYSMERSLGEVTVRLEARYRTSLGTFIFLRTCWIAVELPLDVDVNDNFKSKALFSRFSIRTTNTVPLKITNVQLQESKAYGVKPLPCPLPMTVFDKQPASLTYKVTKKSDDPDLGKKDVALAFMVEYLRMDDVMFERLGAAFEEAVVESPHAVLRRLLVPNLIRRARSYVAVHQIEQAVLLGELPVPTYETLGWDKLMANLSTERQKGLGQWLRDWHTNNSKLHLDRLPAIPLPHKITLTVDVPTISVLHSVTLCLHPDSSTNGAVNVGRPVPATLSIRPTQRWSAHPTPNPLTFVYEIDAPTDGPWLVGGPKRARFSSTSSADEEIKISLILVPLRPGLHLLPVVDIQPVIQDSAEGLGISGSERALHEEEMQVSCETDYQSSGETILVIKDARTTCVTIKDRESLQGMQRMSMAMESRPSVESRSSRIGA